MLVYLTTDVDARPLLRRVFLAQRVHLGAHNVHALVHRQDTLPEIGELLRTSVLVRVAAIVARTRFICRSASMRVICERRSPNSAVWMFIAVGLAHLHQT